MKSKFKMPEGDLVEHEMPIWKTPYNHDTQFESDRTGLYCADPSMTKQEFKEEQDMNVILERFKRSGEIPPMTLPEHFMDISERPTYFDTQQKIAEANRMFYRMDAELRSEFLNDPTRWADAVVAAVEKKDNERLVELGIDAHRKPPALPPQDGGPKAGPGSTPAPGTAQNPPQAPQGATDTKK